MSVVLRCPNCGTTQGAEGECQACHEAKVRYYCTNHEPGIWLTGPTCPQCAARSATPPRPATSPTVPVEVSAEVRDTSLRSPRQALWKQLLAAVLARSTTSMAKRDSARPPVLREASSWIRRLAMRLLLLTVVVVLAVVGVLYLVAHSLG